MARLADSAMTACAVSAVTPCAVCTGDGIAQADMLTQIVAFEHHACLIGEPFGGDAVGRLVDARDAPAVAVAHLIRLAVCTGCGVYGDAGVVVTADDEVADAAGLVAGRLCGGAVDSEGVVEARVEGVGHFPGVTYQQRILPGRSVGQV